LLKNKHKFFLAPAWSDIKERGSPKETF